MTTSTRLGLQKNNWKSNSHCHGATESKSETNANDGRKCLHRNGGFQSRFQYQNRPILSTVFYPNLIHYHAMTFWKFSALSFVSLDTKWYQPRTFSGSCLNCPIHILWFLFKWNHIWGSCCRKGYHLLKECHGMSRIGCDGSLPNSISDDTIGNRNQSTNCLLSASCERSLNFLAWSHTQRQWFRTHNLMESLETLQLRCYSP